MGNKHAVITCLFAMLILSATFPVTASPNIHNSSDVIITIEQYDGSHFSETINISGTSLVPIVDLHWSITSVDPGLGAELLNPINNSSDVFTNAQIENNIWYWELSLPVGDLNCTCIFLISERGIISEDSSPLLHSVSIFIYLGDDNHFPVIEYIPSFQNDHSNNIVTLGYKLIQPPLFVNGVNNLPNLSTFTATICQYEDGSCLPNDYVVECNYSINTLGSYDLVINQSELSLDDGNWLFRVIYQDEFLRYSNEDQQIITFDSNAPTAELYGASNGMEMDVEIYSAEVRDGYEDSILGVTWTITEPDGITRGLDSEEVIDNLTVKIEFNKSGQWTISVLVIDSVGLFGRDNLSVNISNVQPEISLVCDGLVISQDTRVVFGEGSEWYIDASESFDTANDVDNLQYDWYLDGESISDTMIISQSLFNESGDYNVMLVLTDSDGGNVSTSFVISIEGKDSVNGAFSSTKVLVSIVILAVMILLFGLVWYNRRDDNDFKLPKWRN